MLAKYKQSNNDIHHLGCLLLVLIRFVFTTIQTNNSCWSKIPMPMATTRFSSNKNTLKLVRGWGKGRNPFWASPRDPCRLATLSVLMAFIEYPGFPLTNLPTPLRDALQGGLGTIYGINVLLCGVTFFKARARDQPILLWMAKTLSVGGLALDQLTQLPTTEEVEIAKARKGKRALPNRK
jgi:hypothetical protein